MVLINKTEIRFWFFRSLIFLFCLAGCNNRRESSFHLSLQWSDNKATGLIISRSLLPDLPDDSIKSMLIIQVMKDSMQPGIFGEHKFTKDAVIFEPLIPFTRGLEYVVRLNNQVIGQLKVPVSELADAPQVQQMYPSQDTLPVNLLKMYVRFSKPMREGQSLKYITLIKNERDTIPGAFLDLQPELWNEAGTILTLWLDPGRIKRDLQPNINMGAPLEEKATYQLVISPDWPDAEGATLMRSYKKEFVVGPRDAKSPQPDRWTIEYPPDRTRLPVKIKFHETLDYILANEAIRIYDPQGEVVAGETVIRDEETRMDFIPDKQWSRGIYSIRSEGRLEDVAGNNLNRLFDRDVTVSKKGKEEEFFSVTFTIE